MHVQPTIVKTKVKVEVSDHAVMDMIPSPQALIEIDRQTQFHIWFVASAVALGARTYLRLGQLDEAVALLAELEMTK